MTGLVLYRPDDRDGVMPITYFHALARLGLDGLVLVEPKQQFVSVGFFDDTDAAVDVDACLRRGLPVVRREIGGGPVLLGPGQVFYHLVLPRDHPALPANLGDMYRILSAPVIEAYRSFGVEVAFRPINDLVTREGRKITGQGAADIEDRFCFVGAVLRHFDGALMASVLRVPDEKLRNQLHRAIDDNVSSILRETGIEPSTNAVIAALADAFAGIFGPLQPRPIPPRVHRLAVQMASQLQSPDVLFAPRSRRHTTTKIREGVSLHHNIHKAPGGLIRAAVTVSEGVIVDLELAGDFTFIPRGAFGAVKEALTGLAFDTDVVAHAIGDAFRRNDVECPGVTPVDFASAITGSVVTGDRSAT